MRQAPTATRPTTITAALSGRCVAWDNDVSWIVQTMTPSTAQAAMQMRSRLRAGTTQGLRTWGGAGGQLNDRTNEVASRGEIRTDARSP